MQEGKKEEISDYNICKEGGEDTEGGVAVCVCIRRTESKTHN